MIELSVTSANDIDRVCRWHDRLWTFWLGDTAVCLGDMTVFEPFG